MIRASESIRYDTYMAVLERLRGAGWHKVGVINETIPN
jgi:biopolymer transport protein ExbD